jgi:hypothetical protein
MLKKLYLLRNRFPIQLISKFKETRSSRTQELVPNSLNLLTERRFFSQKDIFVNKQRFISRCKRERERDIKMLKKCYLLRNRLTDQLIQSLKRLGRVELKS